MHRLTFPFSGPPSNFMSSRRGRAVGSSTSVPEYSAPIPLLVNRSPSITTRAFASIVAGCSSPPSPRGGIAHAPQPHARVRQHRGGLFLAVQLERRDRPRALKFLEIPFHPDPPWSQRGYRAAPAPVSFQIRPSCATTYNSCSASSPNEVTLPRLPTDHWRRSVACAPSQRNERSQPLQ